MGQQPRGECGSVDVIEDDPAMRDDGHSFWTTDSVLLFDALGITDVKQIEQKN